MQSSAESWAVGDEESSEIYLPANGKIKIKEMNLEQAACDSLLALFHSNSPDLGKKPLGYEIIIA